MISTLPKPDEPKWLMEIDDPANCDFPQQELLQHSFYYPASGFDGDPVAYLAGNFFSFVYADYGVTEKDLHDKIRQDGFEGYKPLGYRSVSWGELTPNGRSPAIFDPDGGGSSKHRDRIKPSFCEWYIFERQGNFDENHGPKRFSLLFLCEDGINAYQWLYVDNGRAPEAIAIIQPGRVYGRNHTDFKNQNDLLGQTVMGNQNGHPEFLLFGGVGGRDKYEDPCWPRYSEFIVFLGNTSIGVWKYRA